MHMPNQRLKRIFYIYIQRGKKFSYETYHLSNQNSLMLYSQRPEYVFDLTYACHEATKQFQEFSRHSLPLKRFIEKNDAEIARYDSLIGSLEKMMRFAQMDE